MTSDRLAKKFVFAIKGRHSTGQQTLYQPTQTSLERHGRLQVMHHAQCHGFITLKVQRQRQAARLHRCGRVEGRRQRDAMPRIAHRPAIVIVQMIGVAEQGGRLPFQASQGFEDRLLGTEMIGMRVERRVRQHDHFRARAQYQFTQIGQQVVPGRSTVDVARQGKWIQLAIHAGVAQFGFAGTHRLRRCGLHRSQLQAEITQLHAMRFRHASPTRHSDAVPGAQTALEPRRLDLVQADLLIMLGFDFTGGEGHDPGFIGLAV